VKIYSVNDNDMYRRLGHEDSTEKQDDGGRTRLDRKKVTTLLPDNCHQTVLKCTDGTEQGRHTGQEQESKR